MTYSVIIDIIAAALIIAAFAAGAGKGLVKSVWRVAAWLITAVLTFMLVQPAADFLSGTEAAAKINEAVYNDVLQKLPVSGTGDDNTVSSKTGIPKFLLGGLDIENIKSNAVPEAAAELSRNITQIAIKIIACIALFIILRLILAALFKILDAASKLPVINSANKLLGGLLGVINILFVIYIVCALVSLFAANESVTDVINSSYIVKYFYNNNILLQLVLRI